MRKDNITVFSNLIWRFAERCGAQGVSLVVSIILARMLLPEVYGTIALVTVFINILNVFVDSGMGSALIQKKEADDLDFSTVFYFNVFVCFVLYLGLFVVSPVVARFYNDMSLVPVIRVLGLTLVISGVKNVQQAYVSRTMQFKRFFFATLGGTIGAAIIGIQIAWLGGGVWALVIQQVLNAAVDTVILWMTVKWRPQKMFSCERLKGMFAFGWKLLVSALLDTVYNNLRQLVIGKKYSSSDLAYYNQAQKFPNLIITNINTSIDSVLLPALSSEQDSKIRIKIMTRKAIKMSIYIIAPLMMGLASVATSLVKLVFTERWLPSVFYIRIFCITYMFYPLHTSNLNAIKAMGRSDIFMKLEIAKKMVGVALLLVSMRVGVEAMAYSLLISSMFSLVINAWPNRKLLNYGFHEQLRDVLPSILLALGMGMIISFVEMLQLSDVMILIVQVVLGVVFYICGSMIFKLDSFEALSGIVKTIYKKVNKE
jgi:O-antigen/teichoic acid export membrane protein